MNFSVIVLFLVFLLISCRHGLPWRLGIWQIMLGGAILVIVFQQISLRASWQALDWNILLYLFGMFVLSNSVERSGLLDKVTGIIFKRCASPTVFLFGLIFLAGFASMFLMNDAVAIMLTPFVLSVCQRQKINSTPFLLALAYAISIGSVTSPIGNPQNLLIAMEGGLANPFLSFVRYLSVPTIINLCIAIVFIRFFYRTTFSNKRFQYGEESDLQTSSPMVHLIAVVMLLSLLCLKIIGFEVPGFVQFDFYWIAILPALFLLIMQKRRVHLLKTIDWHTLIFFAAMFVLIQSVWQSGFFQSQLQQHPMNLLSTPVIFAISVTVSQLISNVPLVALFLPIMSHLHAGTSALMALSAGSTMAGTFLILGAASNVIIVQNAEKRGQPAYTNGEFMRVGVPLGLVSLCVYFIF